MGSILKFATLGLLLAVAPSLTVCRRDPIGEQDLVQAIEQRLELTQTSGFSQQLRDWFSLPRMMSFERFKTMFKKTYRSAIEELDKFKIFVLRSLIAFVSAIEYRYRYSSFYKSINSRSDWTSMELEASRNKHLASRFGLRDIRRSYSRSSSSISDDDSMQPKDERTIKSIIQDLDQLVSDQEEPYEHTWPQHWVDIENDPDYTRIYLRMIEQGQERSYEHLPVKSNFKLLTMDRDEVGLATEEHWDDLWFGSPKSSAKDDAVWVDHRRSGCVQPVQDQADCGSCYAFTTMAFLEWAFCQETGWGIKFSEQYMVDCGSGKPELYGCDGGSRANAAEFVLNFGLELASEYPYKGKETKCFYDELVDKPSLRSMGSIRLNLTHISIIPRELFEEYLEFSPILISLHSFDEFDEYGGGVYDGRACEYDHIDSGHSILLVGHGREDGEEYWLLRNSFGPTWGESGYMKLNKNSNCIYPETGFILGSRNGKRVQLDPRWNTENGPMRT